MVLTGNTQKPQSKRNCQKKEEGIRKFLTTGFNILCAPFQKVFWQKISTGHSGNNKAEIFAANRVLQCDNCGEQYLKDKIVQSNPELFAARRTITWRQWVSCSGKSAPEKCEIKGTLKQATDKLMEMLQSLKGHIFWANWNRNVFEAIRRNLMIGQVVQIFDFAMNFRNMYQDEVQSAYWDGTQMAIHTVIIYFKCPNAENCNENVTLILAQVTDDLQHDSFVMCAGHDAAFRFLAESGVDMNMVLQFCDNCSSQYKSRRPFAECARCPLNIIRVYFGEKHGKSQCDAFFGQLKAWMTHRIKTRQTIITNTKDFFRCCKEDYESPPPQPGICQHYRVVFRYLRASDIRRHQDCDLDHVVPGTHSFYSIRNTPEPLKLKLRRTPCLCGPCIADDGQQCHNYMYTDEWKEVDLIPIKGQNLRKHMKRKDPRSIVTAQTPHCENEENGNGSDNEDLIAEIVVKNTAVEENEPEDLDAAEFSEHDVFIDQARCSPENNDYDNDITLDPLDMDDIIISKDVPRLAVQNEIPISPSLEVDEYIPDRVYWESILGTLEGCTSDLELYRTALEISKTLKPLRPKNTKVTFRPGVDTIDAIALLSIPLDCPQNLCPVATLGNDNCMSRSVSHSYSGSDNMHLEMRARLIIEGLVHKEYYISQEWLAKGAVNLRNGQLPYMFVEYSDHYVNGQRITPNTLDYIYTREFHDCEKVNTYMGLWQLAQAATVLKIPIKSVYPTGTDTIL